jgi:hypothetical protein
LLSVVAQALLCNILSAGFYLPFPATLMMAVSGSPSFQVLDSVLESITGIELPNEVFTSRTR